MAKGKKNLHPNSAPYRVDDTGWRIKCVECGNEFDATRHDAAYCSGACRTRASRAPIRKANNKELLRHFGFKAQEVAKMYKRDHEMFEAMMELKRMVDYATRMFEGE